MVKRWIVMPTPIRFAFLFAMAAAAACPQDGPPPDLEKKLDTRIEKALHSAGAPSVSVAVVNDGRAVYVKAFGLADIANSRPARIETRYAVGSISKQFTAAAILLMEEQGRLSLDDKVSKYFPDLTSANQITIRQLLSHTSGYEDYAPQDYIIPDWTKPTTPRDVVNRWARKPLNFDPGTRWQYSNTNYVLAGEIFEKVSGQPLVAFLRDKIFQPLGMTSAADWPPDQPADARPYTKYALGPPRLAKREARGWYFAAGELAMTPADLAKWDIAFLQRKVLSSKSWEEFTREVKLANGDSTHYALGVALGEVGGMPMYQHGGEVSGFISSNAVFPTREGAVVVLSNQDVVNMVGPLAREIAGTVFLTTQNEPPASSIPEVTGILAALRNGRIDRSKFTANGNSYFSAEALQDCRNSLAALGKLKSVSGTGESLRGGMIHRSYRAEFLKRSVTLNIYVLPSGKYEQFLVLGGS